MSPQSVDVLKVRRVSPTARPSDTDDANGHVRIFKDMVRTVCHRTFRLGAMRGTPY